MNKLTVFTVFKKYRALSVIIVFLVLNFTGTQSVFAEPYLAIRTGQKCMACHINPAGGGKRTHFGKIYGQTVMPAKSSEELLTEQVNEYLDIGADIRGSVTYEHVPDDEDTLAFTTDRATVYIDVQIVPDKVFLYIDQRFAPGSSNREAWILVRSENKRSFLQAGTFYLPYGFRLEDDGALIREVTGVSFNNADNGVMLGHDAGPWSLRASLTNGTNGGGENNTDKQLSVRAVYVKPAWRLGVSANVNNGTEGSSRSMGNVFGGLKAAGLDWMAELDVIRDEDGQGDNQSKLLTYLEVNRELKKGHNVKAGFEYFDPDNQVDEDQQSRTSFVYEYTPLPMVQLRLGARLRDGIPQNSAQNTGTLFGQLHVWF